VSTALFLGLVFLMTVKPDLGGALATVGVAIIAGALSAPLSPRLRVQVLMSPGAGGEN
jgi:hypothetical protein